jgi:hypothetical protein
MVGSASPLDLPLHAYIGILAQRRRELLRQAHKAAIETWHLPVGRPTCRQQSTASSSNMTPNRNPSRGLPIRTKLSKPSDAGTQVLDSIHQLGGGGLPVSDSKLALKYFSIAPQLPNSPPCTQKLSVHGRYWSPWRAPGNGTKFLIVGWFFLSNRKEKRWTKIIKTNKTSRATNPVRAASKVSKTSRDSRPKNPVKAVVKAASKVAKAKTSPDFKGTARFGGPFLFQSIFPSACAEKNLPVYGTGKIPTHIAPVKLAAGPLAAAEARALG